LRSSWPLDHVGGADAAPLARRQPREGDEPITGFLQAVGDCAMLEPPFALKALRRVSISSRVVA
jgi:hypothetical protein